MLNFRATIFLVCVTVVVNLNVRAQAPVAPEWLTKMKRVKLLSDSYKDVLKIFGTPVDNTTDPELSEYFDFNEGRLWVGFESGDCKSAHWKAPKYTVSELSFSPDEWIDPKDLGIKDFNGFTVNPIHGGREGYEYVNYGLGLTYIINKKKIQGLTIRPSKEFDHLLCPH
jgi:hypothetical protein